MSIPNVRQFKLINANGDEYDMTRPESLLHSPDGLGWGTEATINRLGLTYIAIDEQEIHQSPSGEMVFRDYSEYRTFLTFVQVGGLVLCYKPIDTWYYVKCLVSINKSEIKVDTQHLVCPITFTLTSYWYSKTITQTAERITPADPEYETLSGSSVTYTGKYSYPLSALVVDVQGSQELNGYDEPWVGGAGKNKLEVTATTQTINGVTFTVNSDGSVYVSGTGTAVANLTLYQGTISSGDYILSGNISGSKLDLWKSGGGSVYDSGAGVDFTSDGETSYVFRITTRANITYDITISPMVRLATVTDSTFEPYENICPITAYTECTITQTGTDETNTYTVDWSDNGYVYKGTLDVTNGELTVTHIVETFDDYQNSTINSEYNYLATVTALTNVTRCVFNARSGVDVSNLNRVSSSYDEKICSMMEHSFSYSSDTVHWYRNTPLYVYFPISWGTDVATVSATLYSLAENGTPLQFMIPLLSSVTYTLTATEINNLIGSQTFTASTGDITTLTYRVDGAYDTKTYPYYYSYTYSKGSYNSFDFNLSLSSYFKLYIYGEATNPVWRLVVDGEVTKTGKVTDTFTSSQMLVVNTNPKEMDIARYNISKNTRIESVYASSDFSTERIFPIPRGECKLQVLTDDTTQPKVIIEVLNRV